MGDFQANFHRPAAGINTVEGNTAGSRASRLDKKRQVDQEEFEERKRQIVKEAEFRHQSIGDKFATSGVATHEEKAAKAKTVGLVTAEQFKAAQEITNRLKASSKTLAAAAAAAAAADDTSATDQETAEEKAARIKAEKRKKKKLLKQKKKMLSTLSFANEEEIAEEEDVVVGGIDDNKEKQGEDGTTGTAGTATKSSTTPLRNSKKDPTIDTSFLPDKLRDAYVAAEKLRLEKEWYDRQDTIRKEKLEITYSYWDGTGHRRSVVCQKGDTIGQFLELVRQDICTEFKELAALSSDALVYVKEDLIIPQDMTFYDLIVTKARGKSGPLFHFDVHEDIRLGPVDVRVEKDESHPGKVVARQWYERNKHIFPASRWEIYDPMKNYGSYTIHGGEINKGKKK